MQTRSCSLSDLRFALRHLYEPRALQSSPLVGLLAEDGSANAPQSLRMAITCAIEAIKPGRETPPQSPARRAYEILFYRFVQQCSLDEVSEQLGFSLRHLKREQRKALERLAQYIEERYHLSIVLDAPGDGESLAEAADEPEPEQTELRWAVPAPHGQAVDLQGVLPAVLRLVQPVVARYRVTVQAQSMAALPAVAADAVALRQMLLSVLCVVLRRSAESTLLVSAALQGWQVEIGMCTVRARLQPDATAEDAANLDVAQRLAQSCGGSLRVADDANSFAVVLALPVAQQVNVLVIDDHVDVVQLLQRFVTGTRYRVYGAHSAAQALILAQESRPQIIVLDVMMPEIDGWELLGRLREHPLTRAMPVVACTVVAQEELAFALGVSAFLRKPVTRDDFLATLDRLAPDAPGPQPTGARN